MQDAANTAFASWTIPPWATFFLVLTAAVYFRGWRQIRLTRPLQFPVWRLLCFEGSLLIVWLAIASPLDALSGMLLSVHMTQHLLLMSFAPPLVALGAPQVPLLRGLPRAWVREGLGPYFTLAPVQAIERLLKSRLFAWAGMNMAFLAWHLPAAYDLAIAHPQLHEVEHACFFLTSVLFWWPILEPWPAKYAGSRWLLLPYLMSADVVNTALSAFLCFSGRVVYPVYAAAPRLFGISALSDQVAAGSLMWVLGSSVFLGPIMWITVSQLTRRGERRLAARAFSAARMVAVGAADAGRAAVGASAPRATRWNAMTDQPVYASLDWLGGRPGSLLPDGYPAHPSDLPAGRDGLRPPAARPVSRVGQSRRLDLLAWPWLGAFFKSVYGRPALQATMLLIAAAIIVDGFFGHPMSSMNLAGILPWTYARALFVMALLLVGNLFCMSCPFMLPRELAKRLATRLGFARLPWPRRLRGKWLAAVLLGLFFWAYEAFALWDSPVRTAALLLAYFLTALVVDSIFRGASFCKYVCPLGQFNFVSSLLSPVGLEARSQAVCSGCTTRDCIAGSKPPDVAESAPGGKGRRGCELDLFMPQKSGNLDCTLCMDCVQACPHDNIGLFVQPPARELVQIAAWDPQRSSVGRLSRRLDVAALALVMVAAAFAGAAVMVTPVADWMDRAAAALPDGLATGAGEMAAGLALAASAPALLFGMIFVAVLAMHPALARGAAGGQADRGAGDVSMRAQLCRWTLALLPLGLGMWAAHLCFHLVTAAGGLVPGILQAELELHLRLGGAPDWTGLHSLLAPTALLQLQLGILNAGVLGTLYIGWRMVGSVPAGMFTAGQAAAGSAGRSADSVVGSERRGQSGFTVGPRLATIAPWAVVVLLLYVAGVWVLLEPMQMRGMMGM